MCTWIGIDISKDTFDAGWYVQEDGVKNVHVKLPNTPAGFKDLLKKAPKDARFVMESTGVYHLNLAFFLSKAHRYVSVENPLVVKRHIQSDLRRCKSDIADSFALAKYGMEKRPKPWNPASPEALRARHLLSIKEALMGSIRRLENVKHAVETLLEKDRCALKELDTTIKYLRGRLKRAEKLLEECVCSRWKHEVELISSIPGIGIATACQFVSVVEDFNRFKDSRQLVSWLGLSPYNAQSGTSLDKHGGITKMGNMSLRNQLYMCAVCASKSNEVAKCMWERMKAKGKPSKVVLIAIVNKLVKTAFALVRSGRPYDANFFLKTP